MAYIKHVPAIVKMVYLVPFPYFPKMVPKHQFINMVRTMNTETHQYLGNERYTFNNKRGYLQGEILTNTKQPDGRCMFRTIDKNLIVLCYFKKWRDLKGTQGLH